MKLYAYFRESTDEQQIGIDAQRATVAQYVANTPDAELVAEYIEHASGKRNDRPVLAAALITAKRNGGRVIVAKVDRLTRDASFGLTTCKGNDIVFCDHPNMGTLEMCIYFGMAQQEREYISARTRAALQALKQQGVKLGSPVACWDETKRAKGLAVRQANARQNANARRAWLVADLLLKQGKGYKEIADALNAAGYVTARGGVWRGNQIARLEKIMTNE